MNRPKSTSCRSRSGPAALIETLGAANPANIITARVSLITRTQLPEPSFTGTGMPPSANHLGGAPDGFRRRHFTANVSPRNLR